MLKHPSGFPARLFVAGLLLSSFSAHALTVRSSVHIRNLTIDVIDLRPDDGVAPGAEFRGLKTDSHLSYTDYQNVHDSVWKHGHGDLQRIWTDGGAQTHTTPTTLAASAIYDGPAQTNRSIYAGNTYGVSFFLAPYTALRFSAAIDLGASPPDASANASSLAILSGRFEEEQWLYSSFDVDYRSNEDGVGTHLFSRTLQTGKNQGSGSFTLWTGAYAGIHGVPAVPEPSAYAMLLAGLGLVAWRARGTSRKPGEAAGAS
ncbi:PEP-CTERM sorting domain-containing protein [Massilia sp. CCM 9210]|uniref:PEP-CTERM sorting domain-containing protein n=1 Tax=Massilia scottii TaxID=3057166 RepID=UPI002796BC52|nr:PEP-CTERM sorting domain-containing protein [Massilia sp. CCM 9210]MDQ1816497.1 PEP-CTERM sorting domain-containing protein [Massilia sp. CCM 9210]